MIRNYILVALRNMKRNRAFTIINILGLSVAMSVSLVLILMVSDQLSYDRHVEGSDRIYRIIYENMNEPGMFSTMATSAPMFGKELKERFTGVQQVATLRGDFGNAWIGIMNDENIPIGGFWAGPEVLDMFDYELKHGDPATALLNPRSVVITEEARDKLFTVENPLGEIIEVGELGEFIITGVIEDTGKKSHIKFEALASMSSLPALTADSTVRSDASSWNDMWSFWNYIKLEEGVNPDEVVANIEVLNQEQFADDEERNYKFSLQPLHAINPGPLLGNQIGPGMPDIFVYFLGGLCLLIILSAGFNYTNLSVARSLNRAKEVGIRKVSGAARIQIINQFTVEAVMVSLFALFISFGLLILIEPAFRGLKFTEMLQWDLSYSPGVILFCILFAVIVGILSGVFPALFLSSLSPLKVLKDLSGIRLFSKLGLRKALIVTQFVLSLFLIISVSLVQNQLEMMVSADYGFEKENTINVKLGNTSASNLKNELISQSSFHSVSASSHTPGMGMRRSNSMQLNAEDEEQDLTYFSVDRNYIENMGLELIAGENFPEGLSDENEKYMVVNETVVNTLGFNNPEEAIGQELIIDEEAHIMIVGVVKDYNHEPMVTEIAPMALRYIPDMFTQLQVRYSGEKADAIGRIEQSWKKINPDLKVSYVDMEEEIAMFYELIFSDLVKITSVISLIAISIASLGLLGMAIFTAQSKTKEVTIRKVLGADIKSLVIYLSKGYLVLLLMAIVIALPITYLFNDLWLQLLAYRVDIGIGVIASGVAIILGLGLVTILSQTIRAAYANMIGSLRGE